MSDYIEIQGTLADQVEGELAASLSGWPVLGVSVEPDNSGSINVGVWVEGTDQGLAEEIKTLLIELGSNGPRQIEHRAHDWTARWRQGLSAFGVGRRWWIDPHPEVATPAPEGRFRLAVEARAAFGSGTHESTQLVLMELEAMDCRMIRVLDIGTGSGILSMAVDRLGAAAVLALDTDPIAAWETRITAARQPWGCRPLVVAGGLECVGEERFDLILCNMIFSEFSPLLESIRGLLLPDGNAIFSGILEGERGAVISLLEEHGMRVERDRELNGWIGLCAARSGSTP